MTARLWLVIFYETPERAWWANLLRPGFRHVAALSWFADQQRWVYFGPALKGTSIELFTADQAPAMFAELAEHAAAVVRFPARQDRFGAPPVSHCIGAVKGLLGIRSWALTPFGLYRDLLARGGEPVMLESACVGSDEEAAARSAA